MANVTRYTVSPDCDGSIEPRVRGWLVCFEDHDRAIRSLRAKLMRERALRHETAAYEATGSSEHPHIGQLSRERYERRAESFFSRARRLRAEAERVEGGGR